MVFVYLLIGWACISLALKAPHAAGLDGAFLVVAFVALSRACRWMGRT